LDLLERLLSAKGIDDNLRNQLKMYYNKVHNEKVRVNYHFSKNLINKGRLYAQGSLSLQNFKREIRYVLAHQYYYDIDMENCHPRLILQYCEKHKIDHTNLKVYVNERESI